MNISCIEAKKPVVPLKKKVAAYARVSSGKDAMIHSLAAQVDFYKGLIMRNSEWEFAGVFADEAVTGTKENRPQFKRLLHDCAEGKVDLILTKSLSRFSRNTVTTLKTLRQLKEYGVDVWFERENIHSMSSDGEFMLTLLASFAQEESLSSSENQKWKIRKNFQEGIPTPTRMMGYTLVGDTFEVIPEEAVIVKRIFEEYLSGKGLCTISKELNADNIPSKTGKNWSESVIRRILSNEKYVGDLLLQKTYRTDHITKATQINRGELPQYYIKNAHEAIIDRDTFEKVQAEIERRASKFIHRKQCPSCEFTGRIICEQCGKHYRRKKLSSGKVVWICSTFNSLGKAYCPSQQIPDTILKSMTNGIAFSEIRIPCHNTVKIVLANGETIIREWENPSRAESWTSEMKKAASEKAKKRGENSNV